MATVTIKFQNSLGIFDSLRPVINADYPSHFYHLSSFCNQACLACLTQSARYKRENKRSSVLNLPKQTHVCLSLFFQFNKRISVIYDTLSVSCKHVVRVHSPLASNPCDCWPKINQPFAVVPALHSVCFLTLYPLQLRPNATKNITRSNI